MDDELTLTRETQDQNGATPAAGEGRTLASKELRTMDAYWRAANYVSVDQIYLYDNPLLREPLTLAHVKLLVVGHWGATPGQYFIYVLLNRVNKNVTWTCSMLPALITDEPLGWFLVTSDCDEQILNRCTHKKGI